MKKRHPTTFDRKSELKGVVKKIAGKLTSNPKLEQQGREEMLGHGDSEVSPNDDGRQRSNPDPHRRG